MSICDRSKAEVLARLRLAEAQLVLAADTVRRLQAENYELHDSAICEILQNCEQALCVLAAARICTPEEAYGTNINWAVNDLCRAVKQAHQENTHLRKGLNEIATETFNQSLRLRINKLLEPECD